MDFFGSLDGSLLNNFSSTYCFKQGGIHFYAIRNFGGNTVPGTLFYLALVGYHHTHTTYVYLFHSIRHRHSSHMNIVRKSRPNGGGGGGRGVTPRI